MAHCQEDEISRAPRHGLESRQVVSLIGNIISKLLLSGVFSTIFSVPDFEESKEFWLFGSLEYESGDFALAKSPLSPNPMLKEGLAHHKE